MLVFRFYYVRRKTLTAYIPYHLVQSTRQLNTEIMQNQGKLKQYILFNFGYRVYIPVK